MKYIEKQKMKIIRKPINSLNQVKGANILEKRENLIKELGPKPVPPISPLIKIVDITPQGLFIHLRNSQKSIGIISDEAGTLTSGHAMNPENEVVTGTTISNLWDGSSLHRVRVSDGVSFLKGKRVTTYLMGQSKVMLKFLISEMLNNQGLFSRSLVNWPESMIGKRVITFDDKSNEICSHPIFKRFYKTSKSLLEESMAEDRGNIKIIEFEKPAKLLWTDFYNKIETSEDLDLNKEEFGGFMSKLGEQCKRIAAIIEIFKNSQAQYISKDSVEKAIKICNYFLSEFKKLKEYTQIDEILIAAQKLLTTLQKRGEIYYFSKIQQYAPSKYRNKQKTYKLLKILEEHHYVKKISYNKPIDGSIRKDVWRVKMNPKT